MKKFTAAHSSSLLEALETAFPDSSKSTLRSWIKHARVQVNGEIIKIPSHPIEPKATIEIVEKRQRLPQDVVILYQDRDIVVIEKPNKLLTVATETENFRTAHAILKRTFKTVHVVHRLDEETSGVMLFALNERSKEALKKTFEKHKIVRKYCAVIEGHLKKQTGTYRSYLYEDISYKMHSTENSKEGKLAITHYKVVKEGKNFTQLELTLETGRKNQIRVHCQDTGHPILGDKKYGSNKNPYKRLALHAFYLAFDHPRTGKKMQFSSPIPKSFIV